MRICLILLCVLLLAACKAAPDAQDTQGNPVFFKQLRGQYIVINYFAEWCKPCWQEMPELNAFYQQQGKKVKVFGVNAEALDLAQLRAAVQKMGIKFPVLTQDPGKKFGIMSVEGLPMTVIINPEGKKIKTLMGEQTAGILEQEIHEKNTG